MTTPQMFLYHATTKGRAEAILTEGRFSSRNQIYATSNQEFNYFFLAAELSFMTHYQSVLTAVQLNDPDIVVIEIPIDVVLDQPVYVESTPYNEFSSEETTQKLMSWDYLVQHPDTWIAEEVLLKSFSFDSQLVKTYQLDWNHIYTAKQFLTVLSHGYSEVIFHSFKGVTSYIKADPSEENYLLLKQSAKEELKSIAVPLVTKKKVRLENVFETMFQEMDDVFLTHLLKGFLQIFLYCRRDTWSFDFYQDVYEFEVAYTPLMLSSEVLT